MPDEFTINGYALTAGLVFARILPIVVFTPLFGGDIASRRFRMGIAILLSLTFALAIGPLDEPGWAIWTSLLLKEILIGATLALGIVVIFQAFTAAGAVIDLARGASIATLLDPLSRQQTPITGVFLSLFALVVFLSLGGYAMVIGALLDTFVLCPPGEPAPAALMAPDATMRIVGLMGELFALAVRLAAPVLLVILLLDVSLGLINRAAPQIQVFFLGMAAKGWLGLAVLFISLSITLGVMGDRMVEGFDRVSRILDLQE